MPPWRAGALRPLRPPRPRLPRVGPALGALSLVATVACDPCTSAVGCTRDPAAALAGRIVRFPSGQGAPGVVVRVRGGGVERQDTTDGSGYWQVALPLPEGVGPVVARAEVLAPGAERPYVIEGLTTRVSRTRGEAVDVGRWYDVPQLRLIGEVRSRAGTPLEGATVQVDRVGGVDGAVQGRVAPIGRDRRFVVEAPAAALGTMFVRLSFRIPGNPVPFVHDSMPVVTMVVDTAAGVQGTYSLGVGFPYRVRVLRRGTDEGAPGVTVTFRRTGGPRAVADVVQAVTDPEGYATIPLQPLDRGLVAGTLTVSGTGIPTESYPGVRYPTADDDVARFGGTFTAGVQVASVVELVRRTSLESLVGARWTFTPTGGPLGVPLTGVTNAAGSVVLRAPIPAAGTVTGTLAVHFEAGRPAEQIPGVVLKGVADDSVRRLPLLGVGPSALYSSPLQAIDGLRPLAGVVAEFRRRGGVPLAQETFTSITNKRGYFQLFPAPLEDGEVVGDITFRLPPPLRDTTFTNIRLATFRSDAVITGPIFRVRSLGFPYRLRVLRRGTSAGLAGASVTFRRTAGAAVEVDTVQGVTDGEGYVSIVLRPLERGTITGTLTISASGIPTESYPGLRYETTDDGVPRFGGDFGAGVQVASVIELYRRTSFASLGGVPWTFTPVSGPLTTPLSGVTNASGYAVLRAPVGAAGAVVGTLAVRWAPGQGDEQLSGIQLPALADDSVRRAAFLGVGPSALYGSVLEDADGGQPIAGATMEFRRRGGVPLAQELFTTVTNALGIFRLLPAPLEDGEVVGDVTIRPPPPYRDTTVTNVRLSTFRGDETRRGPTFRVRRP